MTNDGQQPGIQRGGAGPRILAEARRHERRPRNAKLRRQRPRDLLQPQLMLRVGVGVQQADDDRRDAPPRDLRDDHPGLLPVQRRPNPAVRPDPLAHLEDQVARHQRLRLDGEEVVEVRAHLAGDLQHVSKTRSGDHRRRPQLALDDSVRGDSRRVPDRAHTLGRQSALLYQHFKHVKKPAAGIVGSGKDFGGQQAALVVHDHAVGERAPDVDGHDRRGHHARRGHAPLGADILPVRKSRPMRSRGRSEGRPYPPPPGVWMLTTSPGRTWVVPFEGSMRSFSVSGLRT
jgi:hypothetical protein